MTGTTRASARYEQPEMRYREWLRKPDMPTPKLTAEIISAAIQGFEIQKASIDARIAELRAMLHGGRTQDATTEAPGRKRRRFSAAARKRMKEAQRRGWAKVRDESQPAAEPAKPKRKLSAAAKAKLVANLKKSQSSESGESESSGEVSGTGPEGHGCD